MGKEAIVVGDSPGFVSNRVLMLTVNEAIFLLHERVAAAEDIDAIFKNCFGHKMGPLETADLIGLDTILFSIEVLYEEFKDSKFRPCPLLKQMVDAGLHGRKSGRGFYNYAD
jgi:3-hydroxybutyryl-CoA dehydrogenase